MRSRRFKLAGVEYDVASVQDVTLRDTLLFEAQMRDLGREMTWPEMMDMTVRLMQIEDPTQRGSDPDALWSLAVTVWASRRAAGEAVTVSQAADFRLSDLEWLDDPEQAPEGAPDPTVDQPGTGLVEQPNPE